MYSGRDVFSLISGTCFSFFQGAVSFATALKEYRQGSKPKGAQVCESFGPTCAPLVFNQSCTQLWWVCVRYIARSLSLLCILMVLFVVLELVLLRTIGRAGTHRLQCDVVLMYAKLMDLWRHHHYRTAYGPDHFTVLYTKVYLSGFVVRRVRCHSYTSSVP